MKKPCTYASIIDHYKWNGRLKADEEVEWMKASTDLGSAIERAAGSVQENGRRFFHQRWLDQEAAALAKVELLNSFHDIVAARDFHELFLLVERLVSGIKGLKEMFVYDVAFRIGVFVNKWPTRVYLHRGTRDGAVAMGFDGGLRWLEVSEFPSEFRELEAYLIENLLCTHKADLANAYARTLQERAGTET
jgi:hypothetical protein